MKKRSPDISLQHKNQASYNFSKKKLLHLAEKTAGGERVNTQTLNLDLVLMTFVTSCGAERVLSVGL